MYKLFLALAVTVAVVSCKKDKDEPDTPPATNNEEEVITTLTLQFVDAGGVQPSVNYSFRDPDGDGGNGPDIHDTIRLVNGTTYNASILLLNETESPADTISNEVLAEDDEHLFCFTHTGGNIAISRTDSDGTYEVGLQSQWITTTAGNGSVQVVLKHQPGVKDGTCSPGDTDIDVTFVTEVQ